VTAEDAAGRVQQIEGQAPGARESDHRHRDASITTHPAMRAGDKIAA
jgi:hypothetical protein